MLVMLRNCTGDDWHLRRTNWCGEAAEILDDEVTACLPWALQDSSNVQSLQYCEHKWKSV